MLTSQRSKNSAEFGEMFAEPDAQGMDVPPVVVKMAADYESRKTHIPRRRRALDVEARELEHISDEHRRGYIEPSHSGNNFQNVLAPKAGDPYGRFTTNFAPLTAKIDKNFYHYTIPVIQELLDKTAKSVQAVQNSP